MIIRPDIFKNYTIIAAQSTRLGGVSPASYLSMNLGMSVNDPKENVIANRELFFGQLGIDLQQLVISKQVHGSEVYEANTPAITEGYDALITNKKNVFLVISVADCTPVLIYDTKNNAVAAIHAGWRGTAGEIVSHTLQKMKTAFGTEGKDCKAYIGACISYENFEVGDEVAEYFDETVKRFDAQKQKWFINLKKANSRQLTNFGVLQGNIEISDFCTVADNDTFFSHRKEKGLTGRMMAVIGMKTSSPVPLLD